MSQSFDSENDPSIFAGVDVGGTSIKIGLVTDAGTVIANTCVATNECDHPEMAIEKIEQHLTRLLVDSGLSLDDVTAVGLGTPGTMDIPAGMILEPPNLPGWRHFPIRDRLHDQLGGVPVTFTNDANAAAFGEYWVGSGRDAKSLVMFTLGTGVGGGIIVNGKSIEGHHSHGAEVGHIVIDSSPTARQCSCGQPGHLEAYASATALIQRTIEQVKLNSSSSLNSLFKTDEPLTGLTICEHAERGDVVADNVIMETARYLGRGIAALAHIVDPQLFVLGGAMNFGGESSVVGGRFLQEVKSTVSDLCFPAIRNDLTIVFSSLGGDAGFIGAAGCARLAIIHQRARNEVT